MGRVKVGPFPVDDMSYNGMVDAAVELALDPGRAPKRAYALHIGGLNHRMDASFINEMNSAELVYADGGSAVLLGRLAGARNIQRAPTTDAGWDVLRELTRRLGRPARLALIGGPPGLATRAGRALESGDVGTAVFTAHGYHHDWIPVIDDMQGLEIDVLLVGLGAPAEMMWVSRWMDRLPPALVLTCGGWFGFLAGEEQRAAPLLRRSGLEWIGRLAQSPRRLGGRYVNGLWTTLALSVEILVHRAHLSSQ